MLYSQADSKKKSNLMMSLFDPGPEPLPWLGKISHLGPISGDFFFFNLSTMQSFIADEGQTSKYEEFCVTKDYTGFLVHYPLNF